jgi:chromosomal replication initiation ATPase DnaA
MSSDYWQLTEERAKRISKKNKAVSPNAEFAKRVERTVCLVFQLTPEELRSKRRFHRITQARHVLFSILWQPGRFRSMQWLANRYGFHDHSTIYHGIQRVKKNENLRQKQITVMALLERELEYELFGPEGMNHGGDDPEAAH